MAKRCTAYGPLHPEELYVEDFLDVARRLERMKKSSERKTEDDRQREEEWKKFSERFSEHKE